MKLLVILLLIIKIVTSYFWARSDYMAKFNHQLGKVLFPLLPVLKNITLTIKKSERWQT